MREIKFRGKRVDNGEWVFGYLLHDEEQGESYIAEYFEDRSAYIRPVTPETAGQFTGLHDKNGVEIYDGDIVREQGTDYTPIYQNGIYMAYNVDKINDPYVSTQFNVIWRNGCEVIGNIHEKDGDS